MADIVVAIDGPAGSGKSSVSKEAARRLGFAYLDTGAAYRALAWWVLERGDDPEDPAAVTGALDAFDYAISTDPDEQRVRVGDADVTADIRGGRVAGVVSAVARVPEVRERVNGIFRGIVADAAEPGIVVEGRDITTVVAPDADARILLTADETVRMARRSAELTTEQESAVAEQLRRRDRADSAVVDFMNAADGVTTVDSTTIGFDETVNAVLDVIRRSTAA